jgi:hypothetical protein
MANVCTSTRGIEIFDWGYRPWINELYTLASPTVDLSSFISSYLYCPLMDSSQYYKKVELFLESYLNECKGISIVKSEMVESMKADLKLDMDYYWMETKRKNYLAELINKVRVFKHFNNINTIAERVIYDLVSGES